MPIWISSFFHLTIYWERFLCHSEHFEGNKNNLQLQNILFYSYTVHNRARPSLLETYIVSGCSVMNKIKISIFLHMIFTHLIILDL